MLPTQQCVGRSAGLVMKGIPAACSHDAPIRPPTCRSLKFVLLSSWGCPHYIGLSGLEVRDVVRGPLHARPDQVWAAPASVAALPGMAADVRTPDKLVDGECRFGGRVHTVMCRRFVQCMDVPWSLAQDAQLRPAVVAQHAPCPELPPASAASTRAAACRSTAGWPPWTGRRATLCGSRWMRPCCSAPSGEWRLGAARDATR